MRKYTLMAAVKEEAHILKLPIGNEFKDISIIDLYTSNFTKEEFYKELQTLNPFLKAISLEQVDLFIARTTYNERSKRHGLHTYECLFNLKDNELRNFMIDNLKREAQARLNNIENKEKMELKLTKDLQEYIRVLVKKIGGNSYIKQYVTRLSSIVDPKSKEALLRYQKETDLKALDSLTKAMQSYKNLRGLSLELDAYYNNPGTNFLRKLNERHFYKYPAKIFFYLNDFMLYLKDLEKYPLDYFPKMTYQEILEMKQFALMEKIQRKPFSIPEMEEYFNTGGLPSIFENMSADTIYGETTDADKVKLGILSLDEYIKKHPLELDPKR